MKKNYSFLVLALFALFLNAKIFAQNAVITVADDYASIPNGSTTTIAIQDVLDNDTFNGMPATLSNVSFVSVSSSSNALTLDENTGSVIFSNGPVSIGTYHIEYLIDAIGSFSDYFWGNVYVNIGCDELHAPIITSTAPQNCSTAVTTVNVSGLPAGQWTIYGPAGALLSGTGSSAVLTNINPWVSWIKVQNYQGCFSPPAYLNVSFLNASMVGHYSDTNADGVPSAGDVIHYSFNVINNSTCTITNIGRVYGLIPTVGTIASLAPGATDTTTLSYDYTLTQADVNAGKVIKSVGIGGSAGSATQSTYTTLSYTNFLNMTDGIKLVAFVDSNANGIQDAGETPLQNGQFTYQINDDAVMHNINAGGFTYLYEVNPANSYDISFSVYAPYLGFYGVAPTLNNITVPNGSGITTYYFPVTITPYIDLGVYMYGTNPRPGFAHTVYLSYTNHGSQTILSGTVTFHNIDNESISSISVPGTVTTADGFTYSFANLAPGESRLITITLQTPTIPTVALGDLVHFEANIAPTADDIRLTNNHAVLTQTIVGSYDPNEKYEAHGGRVVHATFGADDYLTYTITFENTGTANAEFIRITDVLDEKLDETSLMMINASHSYTLDREGSALTWFFDDIQLPPSVANTNIGHGFVTFQVKPKAGYALGDVIPNTANIYFDFNPAIVTNTCTTEFVPNLSNTTFAFDQLQYAPNPVQNQLTLSNNNPIEKVSITNTLGQVVFEQTIQSTEAQINLSQLNSGVYFVKATAQKQSKIFKIIKE